MIFLHLFLPIIFGKSPEEFFDFRDCYQEKLAISILAQLPENQTQSNAILEFIWYFERIRNNYGNMQPIRFSLLENVGKGIRETLL